MTQVQTLFEEHIKEALMVMQGELTGMVKDIVTTLVSPLIQQQLQQSIMTETTSQKRGGKNHIDETNTDDSEGEEYSEEMEDSNSSGDEGTIINRIYHSNRKKKVHKSRTLKKSLSRQGKNS